MSAAPLLFSGLGFSELNGMVARKPSLLAQARQGNREAFTAMVSPHIATVYQRARRMTGNVADAQDVSQEALLKAWSRLEQFSGNQDDHTDDFRAWLARIAANASIDVLRQRRDGKVLSLDEQRGSDENTLGNTLETPAENPEQAYARREIGGILAEAIGQLPGDLREACLLRDVLQYSSQEVADRLGISVVAVRLRLFRAHRRLRERLQDATRTKRRHAEVEVRNSRRARERAQQEDGKQFLPMETAAEYACGD
jgi:RNA polymerase sigma-70 factor, ECF subfamily